MLFHFLLLRTSLNRNLPHVCRAEKLMSEKNPQNALKKYFIRLLIAQEDTHHQSFVETPQNITAFDGEDVVIKCAVKYQKGELIWCKEDS